MRQAYGRMSRLLQRLFVPREATKLRLLSTLAVGFIMMMALTSILGFAFSSRREVALIDYRSLTRSVRILQQALIDAETGVRGFVLADRVVYLEPYFHGLQVVDERGPSLLPGLDEYVARSALSAEPHVVTGHIANLRRIWSEVVTLTESHAAAAALGVLQKQEQKQVMDDLRGFIGAYLDNRTMESGKADLKLAHQREVLLGIDLSGALIAVVALTYAFRRSVQETQRREAAIAESEQTALRLKQLFGMTSMLQSAPDRQDANEVLRATATSLLPGLSGRLYIFNNSQDRLDLSTAWGHEASEPPPDHLVPSTCWAMKSGKPHLNVVGQAMLRCRHHMDDGASLEIPMAAGGQVYGLLVIGAGRHAADDEGLQRATPVATALADAMSLALSGMALRDQLRHQAIRDPLTGLYNRRFLDEMLERLGLEAQRRKVPLAAIMIDLDHFKRLNDQHGHAAGDAVLRGVSGAIVAALRATDIACRYGGEELAILLPDCPLEMARAKAEQLRTAVAGLAPGPSGASVTASFGVSVIPDSCANVTELLASADAALYLAKQNGRNRVEQAGQQASLQGKAPELPGSVLPWLSRPTLQRPLPHDLNQEDSIDQQIPV